MKVTLRGVWVIKTGENITEVDTGYGSREEPEEARARP